MKKIIFLTLLIFNSSIFLNAQENGFIYAKVLDSISNEPVSFAAIRVKNTDKGLTADEYGDFRIPYKFKKQGDTLLISAIGFKTKELVLKNIEISTVNIIRIVQKIEALDDITLVINKKRTKYKVRRNAQIKRPLLATEIVERAINNIEKNYPINPHSYIGYYRDYQVFNDEYYNLNEALIEVFDAGFKTLKYQDIKNQTALYTFDLNKNFNVNNSFSVPYDNTESKFIKNAKLNPMGGNELSLLNLHDPLRNHTIKNFSFIYYWNTDFMLNHDLDLEGVFTLDDTSLYKIKLRKKASLNNRYRVEGTFYISKINFAIYKISYALYESGSEQSKYTINLEYSPRGGKMYLNYISFNNDFKVKDPNSFVSKKLSFNKGKTALVFSVNNPFMKKSLKNKIKIYYLGKKLKIQSIDFLSDTEIQINLKQRIQYHQNIEDFFLKTKKIRDVNNRLINEPTSISIRQFRELFVEEVFPNKKIDKYLYYINKDRPLVESRLNKFEDLTKYWINTPLKKTKK